MNLEKAEIKAAAIILSRLKEDEELSSSEIESFLSMCKINKRPSVFMSEYLANNFETKLIKANGTSELVYIYK